MLNLPVRSNEKSWETKWEEIANKSRPSRGGQGNVRRVRIKAGDETQAYFLKFLVKPNALSRERMNTEVALYETITFRGIPRLIESNAHLYRQKDYTPYLVTEFIEGPNLFPSPNISDSLSCILRLCEIVSYIHSKPVPIVHRDIKPSNIILQNGQWSNPWLVDFGLSHETSNESAEITKSIQQEIGNRFLRLPELSKGSPLKRDPRSDITFCVGILYYLLTGEEPIILLDSDSLMPHQKKHIKDKLQVHSSRLDMDLILYLFDQGFNYKIDSRFQSIDELSKRIRELDKIERGKIMTNSKEKLEKIQDILNIPNRKAILDAMARLEEIINLISKICSMVSNKINSPFDLLQTGRTKTPSELKMVDTLIFVDKVNPSIKFSATYCAYLLGNEIILSADGQNLYRFNLEENLEKHSDRIQESISEYIINGLHSILIKGST